jgi:hypothetical protein
MGESRTLLRHLRPRAPSSIAHCAIRTPIGRPPNRPEFRLALKDTRLINVIFRDEGSSRRAKPYGVSGAVVRWAVLPTIQPGMTTEQREEMERAVEALRRDAAQATAGTGNRDADAVFQRSALATRSPCLLEFSGAERGQTVYVALSWQNEKGVEGTMTDIQSAVIP